MKVVRDPASSGGQGPHAVTIGAYDGLHLGHQAVLSHTAGLAAARNAGLAVVTFEPHPAQVLWPENAPKLLVSLDQKLELLEDAGVDLAVVVPFDASQAAQTPDEFVKQILVDVCEAKSVVVGRNFHFGKGRAGNVEVLTELGNYYGFDVEGLDLLERPDGKTESVSSTAIRRALAGGEVRTAAKMLGRYHEVRGVVVEGDRRGRTIGFPTANVAVPRAMALPADAVYAAYYQTPDGVCRPAAVNIGKRPTFYKDAEHSLVEVHLIGFDGDLYGQEARVCLVELLRSERRFAGLEALVAQLQMDIAHAERVLKREPSECANLAE